MNDNHPTDCGGQAGGCPECTDFNFREDARVERIIQDWHTRETKGGHEWSVNSAGGSRDVEVEYEYRDGPFGGTSHSYLFLTRDDLVAMLAAVDNEP